MSETKSKHSPAPWRLDGEFDAGVEVGILDAEGNEIMGIAPMDGPYLDEWGEQSLGNAHLLVAAPLTYHACKVVLEFLDKLENGTPEGDRLRTLRREFHAPLRAALEPAIAKAEGRDA